MQRMSTFRTRSCAAAGYNLLHPVVSCDFPSDRHIPRWHPPTIQWIRSQPRPEDRAVLGGVPRRHTEREGIGAEPARGGKLEADVKLGSLELIPLGEGEKANVELRAGRGVSWGPSVKGNVFKREVQGGTVGLMIDARGRPLPMEDDAEQRRDRMQRWMWEAGA